jgi:hypothetical protein
VAAGARVWLARVAAIAGRWRAEGAGTPERRATSAMSRFFHA